MGTERLMEESWREEPWASPQGQAQWISRALLKRGLCGALFLASLVVITEDFFGRRKAQIKATSWERHNWYLQCQGDISDKKLRDPLKNFDVGTISLEARSTIQAIKVEMEKW